MELVASLGRRMAARLARQRPLARLVPLACRVIGSTLGGPRVFGPLTKIATVPMDADEMTFTSVLWNQHSGVWRKEAPRCPADVELTAAPRDPVSGIFQLPKGRLVGKSGAVITNRDRLVESLSIEFWLAREGAKHPALTTATLPRLERRHTRALSIATNEGGNYYHWLMDSVPRLALLAAAGESLTPLDELWIAGPAQPFHAQTLEPIGIPSEKIHVLNNASHVEFDHLVVATRPNYPTDFTDWSFAFLREQLRPRLLARAGNGPRPRRFFLSRNDAAQRRVENETELMHALAPHGFERVVASGLTTGDQAALFDGAEAVVAPHGAGLANLIFANSTCAVLELQPNADTPGFFTNIARKLAMYVDIWSPAVPARHDCRAFSVDAGAVKAWAAARLTQRQA
jgi:capsular polysaccharide biosynthesis protein